MSSFIAWYNKLYVSPNKSISIYFAFITICCHTSVHCMHTFMKIKRKKHIILHLSSMVLMNFWFIMYKNASHKRNALRYYGSTHIYFDHGILYSHIYQFIATTVFIEHCSNWVFKCLFRIIEKKRFKFYTADLKYKLHVDKLSQKTWLLVEISDKSVET